MSVCRGRTGCPDGAAVVAVLFLLPGNTLIALERDWEACSSLWRPSQCWKLLCLGVRVQFQFSCERVNGSFLIPSGGL